MQANSAKLAVVIGVGTAVVGTTVKEILDDKRGPSFYVPLAGALVAIPLLVISDFQPDLAGGMGVLILVAALTYSGNSIMSAVKNAAEGSAASGATVGPNSSIVTGNFTGNLVGARVNRGSLNPT